MKDNLKFRLKILAIFAIPLIVTLLAIQLKKATGPYWLGANSDPSYIYLMNSLYITDGIAPIFVDHPGTTVQILGAVVIKILNLGATQRELLDNVFRNPELYMNAIHFVLMFLYMLSIIIVGLYSFKKTGNLLFSIFLQLSPFLLFPSDSRIFLISAEALLVTVVNFYVVCILKLYFDFEERNKIRPAVLFAIVCALGVATKITFLPLLLAPIILLRGIKSKLIFCAVFLLSWFILTIPVIPRYEKMFHWWNGLIVYTGAHGSGIKGFVNIHSYISTIWSLMKINAFLTVMAMCYLLVVFQYLKGSGGKSESGPKLSRVIRFLSVFFLIVAAQFLMAAKQGSGHYMVSSVGLAGLLMGLLFEYANVGLRIDRRFFVAFLFFFVISLSFVTIRYSNKLYEKNDETLRFSTMVREKYKDCIICGYYRSSSPEIAMDFGDDCYGFKAYGQLLQKKYPNAYFYNRWNHLFHRFSDYVYLQDMLKLNQCVLLYGDSAVFPEYIQVQEIESSPNEKLYKVLSTTADEAVQYYLIAKGFEAKKDYTSAYGFAIKAKSMGFPKIDDYLQRLLKKQGGRR